MYHVLRLTRTVVLWGCIQEQLAQGIKEDVLEEYGVSLASFKENSMR